MEIRVARNILSLNDSLANRVRAELERRDVVLLNLLASPGAGKTSLILALAKCLEGQLRIGVIEGDLASRVDADRVAAAGLPVIQINTEGGCHLEARQIADALPRLPLDALDLLIIENVGNLVCTASYDLGEDLRVVLASVPEGHDKPWKYPKIFLEPDAVVVTKTDLEPHVDYDAAAFEAAVRSVNRDVPILRVSVKTGEGLDSLASWLLARVR
ncbi:MAG: hydrogenase nickel incorporation protein HypB [Deltaproteobacteria bacterium]|nr:hydrogenase nickel incorporation protein HypB [Deltaproteobacteria bacterium]